MKNLILHTVDDIRNALRDVKDPEIPVLSLVDLKVVRDVSVEGADVKVRIVPTFTGCPALDMMKKEVEIKLGEMGFDSIEVRVDRTGAWSTDELTPEVRETMRSFGIAPPPMKQGPLDVILSLPVECPHCGSRETQLEGEFGSTLCKQFFYCAKCLQSFERFKPL